MKLFALKNGHDSFTLVETLVAIAIIIAAAGFVLLVLEPDQLIRRARDSARITDMDTLNKALLTADGEFPTGGMGSTYTVYVSLPDSSATTTAGSDCSGVSGLANLPSGWSYHCAASSTYKKVDGTGWIPVNFSSLASGAPISSLPADPRNINTTSSGAYYYTYIYDGNWSLTAPIESKKYIVSVARSDSGGDPVRLEEGTKVSLWNPISQVAGCWPMDNATGTVVSDVGPNGANGSTCNGATCATTGPTWSTGKLSGALSFDGTPDNTNGDWVKVTSAAMNLPGTMTAVAWLYPNAPSGSQYFLRSGIGADEAFGLNADSNSLELQYYSTSSFKTFNMSGSSVPNNKWTHVAVVRDDTAKTVSFYVNGKSISTSTYTDTATSSASYMGIGGHDGSTVQKYKGLMDEVYLYSRALSGAEIRALYENTR